MVKEKEQVEPIPPEEIEEPIDKTLTKETRRIYFKETGKRWEDEPPSEEEAREYVRKAAKSIMRRWQKGMRQYYEAVTTVLGAPPEPEYTLVYYKKGRIVKHRAKPVFKYKTHVKLIPMLDEKPAKVPREAILRCPFEPAHGFSMRQIMAGMWQCVDDRTEVLTRNGFKFFEDVTYKDEIATLNPQTFELEYQKPTNIIVVPYEGEMIHFGGSKCNYDIMVTPNHRMFIKLRIHRYKRKPDYKWVFEDAEKVAKRGVGTYAFKRDFKWNGEDLESIELPMPKDNSSNHCMRIIPELPLKTYLELMGWFISEGSISGSKGGVSRTNEIQIANSTPTYQQEIVELFRKLGLKAFVDKYRVRAFSKHLHSYLKRFGNSSEKYIPPLIKGLTPESIKSFLNVLFKGDGEFKRNGDPTYYHTKSKRLADDVQELIMKAGYASVIYHNKKSGIRRTGHYVVSIARNHKAGGVYTKPKKVKYSGNVYCVTVPNHLIMVRRNGKPVWIGNCTVNPAHIISITKWFPPR